MYHKIIVRMPNPLGDFVMATGALSALRARFPKSEMHIVSPFSSLLPGYKVLPVGVKLTEKYDLGVLFTGSFSSAWHFFRNGVRKRIGFIKDFRRPLLNMPVHFPETVESQHLVQTYHDLLKPLDIDRVHAPILEKNSDLAWSVLEKFGLNPNQRLIGINAGAAYGPAKCWPLERFRAVTERLIEDPNCRAVLFGTPDMKETNTQIAKGLGGQVIDLCGQTSLPQLVACIGEMNAFLTNDSGPMHIAAALKTPLIAIFGSTSDVKTGPYGWGKVIHKRVECSPCYRRVCPIDFRCMRRIESDEVYKEVLQCLT